MQKRSRGIFAAATILTTVWGGACQAEGIVFQSDLIFAILENVEGGSLTLKTLHSVLGRGDAALLAGSTIKATLSPLSDGGTRHPACVQEITALGWDQERTISAGNGIDCLAFLHDARGAAGLVAGTVAPDLVVRVFLASDLVIDRDNAE
ncbi:hypothetical protein GCM10027256_33830 [Novispirillum itersonii subsp. nipponicum]